jgi:hypothetical protein
MGPFLNVPDFGVLDWCWRGDTPFQDNPVSAPCEPLKSNTLAADSLGAPHHPKSGSQPEASRGVSAGFSLSVAVIRRLM